jgi:hypothetical protein
MGAEDEYATIRTKASARDKARVTKAKLGVTWDEFHVRAADTLDPENNG